MASRKAGRCEEGRAQWPCLETWSLRAIPVPKSSRRSYASPTQTSSLVSVASSAPNTTAVQENMHPRPVHKTEKFQATGRPGCCALAARICVALPGTPPASGEGSASRAIFSERRRLQERLRRGPLRGRLRPVSDSRVRWPRRSTFLAVVVHTVSPPRRRNRARRSSGGSLSYRERTGASLREGTKSCRVLMETQRRNKRGEGKRRNQYKDRDRCLQK